MFANLATAATSDSSAAAGSARAASKRLEAITRMTEWGPARRDPENPFTAENTAATTMGKYFDLTNPMAEGEQCPEDN